MGYQHRDDIHPVGVQVAGIHLRLIIKFTNSLPNPIFRTLRDRRCERSIIYNERNGRYRNSEVLGEKGESHPLTFAGYLISGVFLITRNHWSASSGPLVL